MNLIQNYFTSIKNERLKLKGTYVFWFMLISAFFVPALFFIYYLIRYQTLIPSEGVNPWDKFMTDQIMVSASLFIPLFVVLVTSFIIQIELKSYAFKQLFSLPLSKSSIYFGKITSIIIITFFTYVMFFFMMLAIGVLLASINKELGFLSYVPNFEDSIKLLLRSFISILGIIGIQFWISFRAKNFIIPISAGVILVITGLIVHQSKEAIYFPYSYNRLSLIHQETELFLNRACIYSFFCLIITSTFGYINTIKQNIN